MIGLIVISIAASLISIYQWTRKGKLESAQPA
jgi:hypothetical protein